MLQSMKLMFLRQVLEFLLETAGVEIPNLNWLNENKVIPMFVDVLEEYDSTRILECFPNPIIMVGADQTILYANTAFYTLIGKDAQTLTGRDMVESVFKNKKYNHQGRYIFPPIESLETERDIYRKYASFQLNDISRKIRCEVSTKLIRDEKFKIIGVCGIIFDLDEKIDFKQGLLNLHAKLFAQNPDIIQALNKKILESEPYFHKHSSNVAEFSVKLGEKIGLEPSQLQRIHTAALLHDIGKMGVPQEILMKDNPLRHDEFEIIKNHCKVGYEFLKDIPQHEEIAHIILHHHEKWDGTGYPKGLKGVDIPVESRIIALADAFDMMITDKPYGGKMSMGEAMTQLEKGTGIQFDPALAAPFCEIIFEMYLPDGVDNFDVLEKRIHEIEYALLFYEYQLLNRFIHKMFEDRGAAVAKQLELSYPQYLIMQILYCEEGLLVSEIARVGCWHISTVMGLLKNLQEKAFITLERVEKGKGSYVYLSDLGKEMMAQSVDRLLREANKGVADFKIDRLKQNISNAYLFLDKVVDREHMNKIREHIFKAQQKVKGD